MEEAVQKQKRVKVLKARVRLLFLFLFFLKKETKNWPPFRSSTTEKVHERKKEKK